MNSSDDLTCRNVKLNNFAVLIIKILQTGPSLLKVPEKHSGTVGNQDLSTV